MIRQDLCPNVYKIISYITNDSLKIEVEKSNYKEDFESHLFLIVI